MRRSFAGPALLVLTGLLIFGPHAPRSGLHTDDHGFHAALSHASFPAAWRETLRYVPGRNLNILYYWGLYRLLGPSPARLHCAGLALTLLNAVLVWLLCGQLRLPAALRLLAAGLFLVYPNHGETHFWSLAITQNVLPTTLVLLAVLIAGSARLKPAPRLALAMLVYTLAFFDYDQAFFMWIPLLFYFWFAVPGANAPPRHKAALAAFCLAMSVSHVLLRVYVPISDGGRPVIRFGGIFRGFAHSLLSSFVPLQKLPAWDFIASWAGGPVPTILMSAVLASAWLGFSVSLWREEAPARTPVLLRAAAFGVLWFFCAYLPNYFWFISPRHNYIPSIGLLIALVAAAALVLRKARPAARAAAAVFAFLAFGLFAVADAAEGSAWARSSALLDSVAAQAAALLPPRPENLFLLGAPATLGRAPAFKHPQEAAFAFDEKTGDLPAESDLLICPGRSGFFFFNEVDLFGEESLQRRGFSGANILALHPDGKVGCAKALVLTPPGLPAVVVDIPSANRCAETVSMSAPAWLVSSRPAPAAGPALFDAGNGAALTALSAREGAGWVDLTLRWRAEARLTEDFAVTVTLLDATGRTVFAPVYSSVVLGRKTERALWPAYDDAAPPSGWRKGSARVEIFRFRNDAPLPPGSLRARLFVYTRNPRGPWTKSGPFFAPVSRS